MNVPLCAPMFLFRAESPLRRDCLGHFSTSGPELGSGMDYAPGKYLLKSLLSKVPDNEPWTQGSSGNSGLSCKNDTPPSVAELRPGHSHALPEFSQACSGDTCPFPSLCQQGPDSVVLLWVHSQEWRLLLSQHLSSSEGFHIAVALNPRHRQAGQEVQPILQNRKLRQNWGGGVKKHS